MNSIYLFTVLLFLTFSPQGSAKHLALVSSGGVSLGSYEAGVLQEFLSSRKSELPQNLKVVLGASAGGINGLLTVFEACRSVPSKSMKGLLWKMWIPVGLDQLQDDDPSHKSLFHRNAIKNLFKELRTIWSEGFKESCNVVLGITVTRRNPFTEEIQPGLSITRQPEIFLLKIQGKGPGRAPEVQNYDEEKTNTYRVLLPLEDHPDSNLEKIFDVIQASASFPLAFSPYPITYCLLRPGVTFRKCKPGETQTDLFIDGGIYHNSPVGRAFQILKQEDPSRSDLQLIYVNASAPMLKKASGPEEEKDEDWGLLSEFYDIGSSFFETARNMTLSEDLQRSPELGKYLITNQKHFPLVSEPLYAFLGFIEKDFRISDYYLGIADGQKMLSSQAETSKEYLCFSEHLKNDTNCSLTQNLKILAKLATVKRDASADEASLHDTFDYLEKTNFHFKDLGLKRRNSRFGRIALRNRFKLITKSLKNKQPEGLQGRTKIILDQGLNQISYYPSSNYAYALFGDSPEAGLSVAYTTELGTPTAFRLNASLMMIDYLSRLGDTNSGSALAPLLGFRYQPLALSTSLWQVNFGLRTGYVFSDQDKLGKIPCDTQQAKTRASECSGLIFQQVTSLTFFERLRLQFVYQPDYGNNFGKFQNSHLYFQIGLVFPDIW